MKNPSVNPSVLTRQCLFVATESGERPAGLICPVASCPAGPASSWGEGDASCVAAPASSAWVLPSAAACLLRVTAERRTALAN